jgi:hypothetical protein
MSIYPARLLGLVALLAGTPAWAECDISADGPSQVRFTGENSAGYDSFARANYSAGFAIRLANRSADDSCKLLVSIQRPLDRQALGNGAGAFLNYEVVEAFSRSSAIDPETSAGPPPNALRLALRPRQRVEQQFRFFIPPGQIVPSGAYSDELAYRIYDADTLELLVERGFQVQTRVSQQMAIFIADNTAGRSDSSPSGERRGRMDFGRLTTNESRSLGILVLSNDDYAMRLESENHGALQHVGRDAAARIPYTATLGGRAVDLSNGSTVLSGYAATTRRGLLQSLNVVIGEVGAARAGQYRDRLMITVEPDS